MENYCGANCGECAFAAGCKGCVATCGKPFGGACLAAQYIRLGGTEAYRTFKEQLRQEVNTLLSGLGFPETPALYELTARFVNLQYPLPNGGTVSFLDDREVVLGCQIELGDTGRCAGVVVDADCIVIGTYGENGADPELMLYQKR